MPYLAPSKLIDALALLGSTGARVVAGGTDYFPSMAPGRVDENILDVTGIDGFRGITSHNGGWRIGAATTWTDILRFPFPPAFDGLKLAAREVGSVQIQNRATIAGNICNASPAADGVPPLMALDASVETVSEAGSDQRPLSLFITGVRQTKLASGELVSAIVIPPVSAAAKGAFVKLGSRKYLVISISMVAAVVEVEEGIIVKSRIVAGSCSPVARRLEHLESRLCQKTVEEAASVDFGHGDCLKPLEPVSDVRGSADYRMEATAELCRRAVLQACGKAKRYEN